MKCPRCSKALKEYSNNNIKIDVCSTGCGGIWFDWQELKQMDEKHESDAKFLKQLSETPTQHMELKDRVNCPHCESIVMYRRYHSVKRKVQFDECPKCGGIWLDAGELTDIYAQFDTDAERKAAADAYVMDVTQDAFSKAKIQSQKDMESINKIASALRFISPSYYFPNVKKGF